MINLRHTARARFSKTTKLYLDLLEDCLTGYIYADKPHPSFGDHFSPYAREEGLDWPATALTMIGRRRLHHLRLASESVLKRGVKGDFVETGVWRGGACILLRAVLEAYSDQKRKIWLFDSFQGLPPPDEFKYPQDQGSTFHTYESLQVSLEAVKCNFEKFGFLDEQVVFVPGWFRDTLPAASVKKIAILRLDGDMYESTVLALDSLYPKVSRGGIVIIDDYQIVPQCEQAVQDFFRKQSIGPKLEKIDTVGVFWRKP